jgi:uncharacterized protein YqfB (UPF0267 family)
VEDVTVGATEEAEEVVAPKLNDEGVAALGVALKSKFEAYKSDRVMYEQQWLKNNRQIAGEYDPEMKRAIGTNRSQAYPKLTRVKCISTLSRLMNLLFNAGEKNYEIAASPVPDLEIEELDGVLKALDSNASSEEIEDAIKAFASARAKRLELEIDDQLQELGGDKSLSYVALCRKVLMSGIRYGVGVLEGPFAVEHTARSWTRDSDGTLVATKIDKFRPMFDFVPIWDYYPDLSAKYFHQMDGRFRRIVMTKSALNDLKRDMPGVILEDKVDAIIRKFPNGNYVQQTFEVQLRAEGSQSVAKSESRGKYEVLRWIGNISAEAMKRAGIAVPEERATDDVIAHVMLVDNIPIMVQLDPWGSVNDGNTVQMYHHFLFEESESSVLGEGLPEIIRDSQLGVCAAARMILDNASVMRNFEVNRELLVPGQDTSSITTDKCWYREDGPATAHIPAVRAIELPTHLPELLDIMRVFKDLADEETFVSAATGGDLQKGPSEPFRTAAGASMLQGMAALPFKDVVRNFDMFTESVLGAMIVFNKVFNENVEGIKGDFRPVARGATSLIAKEVLGIQLDNFATTLTDEEKKYVKFRNLAAARVRVRDLDDESVIVSEREAKEIDALERDAMAKQQAQQEEMIRAEIRKILADSFKSVALANKSLAAAEAQSVGTVLDAMEQGINAAELSGKGGSDGERTAGGIAGDQPASVQGTAGSSELGTVQANQQEDVAGGGTGFAGAVPGRGLA